MKLDTVFTLGREITAEQRAFLDEHGFLHFRGVASAGEVEMLRAEAARIEAQWIAERRRRVNGIPLFYGADGDGETMIHRLAFTSQFSEPIRRFVRDPRFLPLLPLVGPDARVGEDEKDGVVMNRYVNSKGSRYARLGWHTDGLRDLAYLRMPGPMLNFGLHLDRCTAADGGLRLIPGTHRQGFLSMCFHKPYFLWHRPDPRELCVETEPGDLTIHDGRLWHRVARSPHQGGASTRRTMFVPYLVRPYQPKSETSPTPVYHTVGRWLRALQPAWLMILAVILSVPMLLGCGGDPIYSAEIPVTPVAVQEAALTGTFARVLRTTTIVPVPLLGDQEGGGFNHMLVERYWDRDAQLYRQSTQLCAGENVSVLGVRLDLSAEAWALVPPSSETVEVDHAAGRLVQRGHVQQWGIRLPDPLASAMPHSKEEASTPPMDAYVYDMDGDGHPGVTMHATGFVSGDVYAVQRKTAELQGVTLGPDRTMGIADVRRESLVLGATSDHLDSEDSAYAHPDPLATWYSELRLPSGSGCAEVLAARDAGRLPVDSPFGPRRGG